MKNISSGKEDKLEEGGQQIKNQSGTKDNSEDIAQTKNDFENITKIEEGIIKETKSINEDIKESQLIQKFISPPSEVTLDPQNPDLGWSYDMMIHCAAIFHCMQYYLCILQILQVLQGALLHNHNAYACCQGCQNDIMPESIMLLLNY